MNENDYQGPVFSYEPSRAYPIVLRDDTQVVPSGGLVYDEAEAESMLEGLAKALDELREATTSYVQVTFTDSPNAIGVKYTYIDPTGALAVGDRVEVPTSTSGPKIVKVVALGRGSYQGRCKKITAKLVREEL